jgi:serine/threonine protein phosphatase 1
MPLGSTFRFGTQKTYRAPDIAPDTPFWAVGDVHGRYDLLAPLLERLLLTDDPIVLVGDYINKGPDSAAVLRLLKQATDTGQVIALRGNHEELLLRYMIRPRVLTDMFLSYGGGATLQSFGIACDLPLTDERKMSGVRNQLRDALGELTSWLETLPFLYTSGNVSVLHAGADPQTALAAQFTPLFCWGHPMFHKTARPDGQWIAHGHQPVSAVSVKERRIALDTQADQSGTLSAVHIAHGAVTLG